MYGHTNLWRLWQRQSVCVITVCLAATFALAVVGCADHRISLSEFLTMQQAAGKTAADQPTTQPAVRKALSAVVDKHLGPYRVGPADVLVVTLTQALPTEPIPPVQVRLDKDGTIDMPIVGPISVADMELSDVEDTIQKAYVPKVYRNMTVNVELRTADTTHVLVTGAVPAPGMVHLRRTECNMLYAIVSAGGVSQAASGHATLRRIRRPDETVTLNLTDPVQLKGALAIDPLESGDIILVHSATPNMIFVGGLVNAPRPQTYPPGVDMTILQAIAAAGGLRTDVTPREGTLIRRMPNADDVHVKLDLDRITSGKDPNIVLAAGDILWVPYTAETRIQEWINRNIFFRAGVSATYTLEGTEDYLHTYTGGGNGRTLQDVFDPLGSLTQNAILQQLGTTTPP